MLRDYFMQQTKWLVWKFFLSGVLFNGWGRDSWALRPWVWSPELQKKQKDLTCGSSDKLPNLIQKFLELPLPTKIFFFLGKYPFLLVSMSKVEEFSMSMGFISNERRTNLELSCIRKYQKSWSFIQPRVRIEMPWLSPLYTFLKFLFRIAKWEDRKYPKHWCALVSSWIKQGYGWYPSLHTVPRARQGPIPENNQVWPKPPLKKIGLPTFVLPFGSWSLQS